MTNEKVAFAMDFLRENAYPYYEKGNYNMYNRWQDKLYLGLLHSISKAELGQVIELLEADPECPIELRYKAIGVLKSRQEAAMTAIDTTTLLGWYADKKSGKVNLSIKSLMLKYPKESVESQEVILKAFIMGGKKEMEWAGRRLRNQWMEALAPYVDLRWKSTRNPILAYVILRHFPNDYILEEQETLAEATKYAYICARLSNVEGFHMDSKRLSTPDFLYVLAKWDMGKSTAINIDVLADRMLNAYMNEEEHISPHDVEIILWSLGKLGLTDNIIHIKPKLEKLMTE